MSSFQLVQPGSEAVALQPHAARPVLVQPFSPCHLLAQPSAWTVLPGGLTVADAVQNRVPRPVLAAVAALPIPQAAPGSRREELQVPVKQEDHCRQGLRRAPVEAGRQVKRPRVVPHSPVPAAVRQQVAPSSVDAVPVDRKSSAPRPGMSALDVLADLAVREIDSAVNRHARAARGLAGEINMGFDVIERLRKRFPMMSEFDNHLELARKAFIQREYQQAYHELFEAEYTRNRLKGSPEELRKLNAAMSALKMQLGQLAHPAD